MLALARRISSPPRKRAARCLRCGLGHGWGRSRRFHTRCWRFR